MSDSAASAEAHSLQCDICGVKLRNTAAAQIHAEKTEHQAFSESTEEIKPLTEEEKKAKLQELRDKLAAKRKLEAEKELENVKKNASIERKKTQESSEVIEELKRKEELKQIAAKKKEKEEDLKAKQRVKAQLEQDKKDRAERAAREKALRSGQPVPSSSQSNPPPPTSSTEPRKTVDHSSGRLQIRHANGKPIVRTWDKNTTMLQVALDIKEETGIDPANVCKPSNTVFDSQAVADYSKATFKMFGQIIKGESLQKSLEELKLVPSASLQLT